MTTINRTELLEDIKFYLLSSNILTDIEIAKIYEKVIAVVGDDDTNYDEVVCKSLRPCAEKNKRDQGSTTGSLKKQKVGPFDEEYYQGGVTQVWVDYLDDLPGICSSEVGYTLTTEGYGGIYINPGDEIDVNPTTDTSDLYL